MTKTEAEIQTFLQNWRYTEKKIEKLKGDVRSMTIKVTTTYSVASARSIGTTTSSVENYCIRKDGKTGQIRELEQRISDYEKAIDSAKLTDLEREAVECLKDGLRISDFARKEHLYTSYAYKIKDKAISKIEKALRKTTI